MSEARDPLYVIGHRNPDTDAEEVRGLMIMSADDIDIPESLSEGPVGEPCTSVDALDVCGDDGLFRCFVTPQRATGECFNTKFPSVEGWDWHFGYGRNNARRSVDMIMANDVRAEEYRTKFRRDIDAILAREQ